MSHDILRCTCWVVEEDVWANSVWWPEKKLLDNVISKRGVEGLVGIGQAKGRWEWTEIQSKNKMYWVSLELKNSRAYSDFQRNSGRLVLHRVEGGELFTSLIRGQAKPTTASVGTRITKIRGDR